MYDYFYGAQADQFSFIRIPTVLFSQEQFKNISPEAKVLYGILLKRMDLSAKNGWFDDQGRVYIICTLEEIMETLNCGNQKAVKLMDELEEKCGLIERKRQGQGKPNLIYVKNFISAVDNPGGQPAGSRFKTRENHDSGVVKTTNQELQGESYVGLSVRPEGKNAAVTMNLHELHDQVVENPKRLAAVMSEFLSGLDKALEQIPQVDVKQFTEYENVNGNLMMQVIPVEPNKEKLEQIPHKTIEDIAVVYRIDVSDSRHHSASVLVTNQMLDQFGITPEQLHMDAVTSQMETHPPTLKNMSEMMAEMSGGMMDMPESPMWVVTVEGGLNGAAVVQIPEFMDQAAEKLGGNFFVLPSSIHECLFIKDDGEFQRPQLEEMVQSVNATEVSAADFLSDSVYHYDSEARVFEKATTFESRVAEAAVAYETTAPETAKETMTVLLVDPEKYPHPVEIGTDLEDLQKAVGGYIEVTYPFNEQVGLVMNEEGKLEGLPLNRAIRDDDGQIFDVVAGSFLVVGLTEESFGSLTPDQMKKFEQQFHQPEVFIHMGKGVMALPMPDEAVKLQEEKAAEKIVEKAGQEKKTETPAKKPKKTKEESR